MISLQEGQLLIDENGNPYEVQKGDSIVSLEESYIRWADKACTDILNFLNTQIYRCAKGAGISEGSYDLEDFNYIVCNSLVKELKNQGIL